MILAGLCSDVGKMGLYNHAWHIYNICNIQSNKETKKKKKKKKKKGKKKLIDTYKKK